MAPLGASAGSGVAQETDMSIRILLADDHPIFSNGTRTLLEQEQDMQVIGALDSADALMKSIACNDCDVVITDFNMPGAGLGDGLELLAAIKAIRPQLPVIVLTMISTAGILRSILDSGVAGLVSKVDTIVQLPIATRSVVSNKRYVSKAVTEMLRMSDVDVRGGLDRLTAKELRVLKEIISGTSVTQIAEATGRSVKTISSQKVAAMEKLGLRSELELFAYARQHKL
jgi:two-component system capsular synthesis response regulator RcsB